MLADILLGVLNIASLEILFYWSKSYLIPIGNRYMMILINILLDSGSETGILVNTS